MDYVSLTQAYPDASDEEDLVEIANIEPYAAPGSLLKRPTQPNPLGQSQTEDASRIKTVNPYDNVTDSPDEERRYLNVEEMREHERMSSCECALTISKHHCILSILTYSAYNIHVTILTDILFKCFMFSIQYQVTLKAQLPKVLKLKLILLFFASGQPF